MVFDINLRADYSKQNRNRYRIRNSTIDLWIVRQYYLLQSSF